MKMCSTSCQSASLSSIRGRVENWWHLLYKTVRQNSNTSYHLLIFANYYFIRPDETFIVLYKELQFRHIYAKHKVRDIIIIIRHSNVNIDTFLSSDVFIPPQPTIEQRFESYQNYVELFNLIIGTW